MLQEKGIYRNYHAIVTSMSNDGFKKNLTNEEFHILREAGTEAPFSGEYVDLKADGMYHCRA